ncbi:MAG: hypothetical protein ACFB21_10475 [Opitutales bacterium]
MEEWQVEYIRGIILKNRIQNRHVACLRVPDLYSYGESTLVRKITDEVYGYLHLYRREREELIDYPIDDVPSFDLGFDDPWMDEEDERQGSLFGWQNGGNTRFASRNGFANGSRKTAMVADPISEAANGHAVQTADRPKKKRVRYRKSVRRVMGIRIEKTEVEA